MQVRPLEEREIPLLLDLYRHLNPDDPPLPAADAVARWRALRSLAGSDIFVGCLDGRPVATCTLVVIPNLTRGGMPYALIENVVTDSAFRNRGHGKHVLRHAASVAWEAGCYKVMLLTGSVKPETLNFYESAGFRQNKTGFQMRRPPPRSQ